MSTSREKMQQARELIQAKRYDEARALLRTVDHDMALDWLDKISKLDPTAESQTQALLTQLDVPPKSYTNSAVVVLVLYFVFWLPGLIVNAMYLNEASRVEKDYGEPLPGVGALRTELWVFGYIPLIVGLLILVFAVILGPSISQANDAIYRNIVSGL